MTCLRLAYVYCDGPECGPLSIDLFGSSAQAIGINLRSTAAEWRGALRRAGWIRRPGGRDYCPDCAEHIKAAEAKGGAT